MEIVQRLREKSRRDLRTGVSPQLSKNGQTATQNKTRGRPGQYNSRSVIRITAGISLRYVSTKRVSQNKRLFEPQSLAELINIIRPGIERPLFAVACFTPSRSSMIKINHMKGIRDTQTKLPIRGMVDPWPTVQDKKRRAFSHGPSFRPIKRSLRIKKQTNTIHINVHAILPTAPASHASLHGHSS